MINKAFNNTVGCQGSLAVLFMDLYALGRCQRRQSVRVTLSKLYVLFLISTTRLTKGEGRYREETWIPIIGSKVAIQAEKINIKSNL